MLDQKEIRPPVGLPAEITRSLGLLWTRYAGAPPSDVRTELRGNVVTCVLVNAVHCFERNTAAPCDEGHLDGTALTLDRYKTEAVGSIVRLTRQRVASFRSSHDRDTDVATEIFELEPSPMHRDNRRR
jgi:hypothetical protein